MSIKYYRLVGYDPYWIKMDGKYPRKHIEDLLANVTLSSKRYLTKQLKVETEHWKEVKNITWNSIEDVEATGYAEDIPKYIKVDNNGTIYYYYLLDTPVVLAGKGGKSQYKAVYKLDDYMTIYWNKLEILRKHNPRVYANRGFFNRWDKRNEENSVYYYFDFINSKWLGQTLNIRNNQLIRKLAYYTNAQDIYSLNFPESVIPSTYSIKQFDADTTITLDNFVKKLETPNSRGRYLYFVAKSTAKMTTSNSELVNQHTNQKFILIPFFADSEEQTWKGLNDFDVTKTGSFLVPSGDNEIGIYECDIPYSIFYGYVATKQHGATMLYAKQPMSDSNYINIPFFEINNNAPMLLKIIDFDRYKNGFSGKFDYIVNNITMWVPDTEPAFLNPLFYKEQYKIGDSQIVVDASMFHYRWSASKADNFGIEAYLSFSNGLNLAYNFGDNTNTALATYDNTQTVNGTISIPNMYMGSNSANYFTTNSSTIATSIANRKSEEAQAWTDAALNTAKTLNSAAPDNILDVTFNVGKTAKKAVNATLDIAKTMTDTALTQQRANRDFKTTINNITSAPSQILSAGDVKGVIPNRYGLFECYSLELHPLDKDVGFADYTHNGYPFNCMCYFNDVADNRQVMNVINLNTTYFEDELLYMLDNYDNTYFNTKYWNKQFLVWLNTGANIYNTNRFVNCTDYLGDNYISNIETELPDIPVPKTYIGKYITNFRENYRANASVIKDNLIADNPNIPIEYADIWDNVNIEQVTVDGFIINAKVGQTKFYGSLVVNTSCYRGYVSDTDTGTFHYFWDVDFLCNSDTTGNVYYTLPDGTSYFRGTFNYPVVMLDIEQVPDYFLFSAYNFNSTLTLNEGITSIGTHFLDADHHYQSLVSYYSYGHFNQNLTIPNSVKSVGAYFMNNQPEMISTINIQDLLPEYFTKVEDTNNMIVTDTNSDNKCPAYDTGVTIIGTNKDSFITRFPKVDSRGTWYHWYRNLI